MTHPARALVERLKRETAHLPSNVPLHNVALETITEILDLCVEPEEVEEPADEEPEPEAGADPAASQDPAGEPEEGDPKAADDGSGPMTTGNAPT